MTRAVCRFIRMSGGCHRIDSFAVYAARVGHVRSVPLAPGVAPGDGAAVPGRRRPVSHKNRPEAEVLQYRPFRRMFPPAGAGRMPACRYWYLVIPRAGLVMDAVAPPSS
ncbi:hypothetical protein SAMN05192539_1004109 [Paraburkholderia diazotrophica]|uniref:Uncharacterized protein n=1 Tax=Paraburkholderia diazotrophica TaxID=667676 RepID=A0A1H6THK2_9BURK|nr:hypothetical protein SAMN05192539_1004109 [Paraburkholderia diazotrophica]